MSSEYIQKWIKNLHGVDREISRIACEKLAKVKDPSVVSELAKVLINRPPEVRAAAARALGDIGDRSATPALIKALEDYDPIVSSAAADAIGQLGDPRAIPALQKVLQNYRAGDHYHQLHGEGRGLYMAAVNALQRIGTMEAKVVLRKYTSW